MVHHDRTGPQPRRDVGQNRVDDRVIGQREMHVIGGRDCLSGCQCDDRAGRLQRLSLGHGPIPYRHRIALREHALDHRRAEQPRSEKRHVVHALTVIENTGALQDGTGMLSGNLQECAIDRRI